MPNVRALSFDDLPSDGEPPKQRKTPNARALSFDDIPSAPLTPIQGAGALASGFNRAALTALPGLPVKAALDVADLGRAAYGYLGHKAGILTPDEMPQPVERSQFVGSPEWIASKLEATELGKAAIANPRADDPTARLLHAGGFGAGAGMSGRPGDLAMQFASGGAGQLAIENGASPEWAMVASMAPATVQQAGAAGIRGAARGGEAGRREMQQRIADFERAGVEPSVGLATGNRRMQAVESALAKTPGGAGAMARKGEQINEQLADSAASVRDRLSADYGPVAAGEAIKGGVSQYRDRRNELYGRMLDQAVEKVPPEMRFPADAMLRRGAATLADIEGAPNVSRVLNEPLGFTQKTLKALEDDAIGSPAQQAPSRILREDGTPFVQEIPGTPGGLPFEAIRGLRSRVGELAYSDNPLLVDRNTGAMRQLYGGAKADLMTAGRLADAERIAQGQAPGVARQLERSDRFYAKTQTILERTLAPLYKAGDPASEKSYYRMESDLRNAGKQAMSAMASLPLDVRKTVTATAVDRMGRAAPGQQNADGSAFSAQTFLTNWNRITPEGKNALFSTLPQGSQMRDKLDAIAKAAEHIRKAQSVFSNPSGTAAAAATIGTAATAGGGLMALAAGNTGFGASALSAVVLSASASRLGAWGMTNPKFVNWLAQTSMLKPQHMRQHLTRLAATAQTEKDPEQLALLEGFVRDFGAELDQAEGR